MRWKRRDPLPDDVRDSIELEAGERVLASAQAEGREWLVATDAALLLPDRRLPWVGVATAGWDQDSSTLTVEMMRNPHEPPPELLRRVVPEPGFLPETVRERIEASIIANRHVRVRGKAGLRVLARSASRSDELVWQVVLDKGLEAGDPLVRSTAEQALDELRRELRR